MRPLPSVMTRSLEGGGAGLTIVVIRLGAMGDVLRTLPAVRLVRRGLPRARLLWVVEDIWAPVIEGHRDLDGTIAVPRREWKRASRSPRRWPSLVASVFRFRRRLRDLGADLAVDFHGNLRSGLIGHFTRAPVRLGYDGHQQKEGNRLLTTHHVAAGDRRTPRLERNLDLVRALGLDDGPLPEPELPLCEAGADRAAAVLRAIDAGDRGIVVVGPGASRAQAYKKPPSDLLAAACRAAAARGRIPLVVWGPGEDDDARRAVEAAGDPARLAPPTDLPTLAALLRGADLFVGGDSGPLHMACAVGCPVLGIYGPTDPQVNRPWGVPFRAAAPPGRVYTGIKKIDRGAGGFDGLTEAQIQDGVTDLLDGTDLRRRVRSDRDGEPGSRSAR